MKQVLLFLAVLLSCGTLISQTIVLDFEGAATSTTYQYFGSSLDGTKNNVIPNPDASGINTSSTVADHVKPAGSEVWAGAFPSPGLTVPINLVANNQICIKVWFPTAGNIGIKLEGSATNGNWINTVDVSQTQTWVEVCVDPSQASIEAPVAPAAGHVYTTVVLFFNFGVSPGANVTYYWDDLVLKSTSNTSDLVNDLQLFTVSPTLAGDYTTLFFNQNIGSEKLVRVFSATGSLLETVKVGSTDTDYLLETANLSAGIYLVNVQAGSRMTTQKFVKR